MDFIYCMRIDPLTEKVILYKNYYEMIDDVKIREKLLGEARAKKLKDEHGGLFMLSSYKFKIS